MGAKKRAGCTIPEPPALTQRTHDDPIENRFVGYARRLYSFVQGIEFLFLPLSSARPRRSFWRLGLNLQLLAEFLDLRPQRLRCQLELRFQPAELKTPVIALGLSTRALNTLERTNVITVRDLLSLPIREIHLMRGVGNQTRQESIHCVAALKERFPNDEEPAEEILGTPTLETLRNRIVGTRNANKETDWNIRCGLLGLTSGARPSALQWPSQTNTADSMNVSPSRVYQTLAADRTRWSKDPLITAFRHELCEQIRRLGGIVTIPELIDLTLLLRPASTTLELDRRRMMASAVA